MPELQVAALANEPGAAAPFGGGPAVVFIKEKSVQRGEQKTTKTASLRVGFQFSEPILFLELGEEFLR